MSHVTAKHTEQSLLLSYQKKAWRAGPLQSVLEWPWLQNIICEVNLKWPMTRCGEVVALEWEIHKLTEILFIYIVHAQSNGWERKGRKCHLDQNPLQTQNRPQRHLRPFRSQPFNLSIWHILWDNLFDQMALVTYWEQTSRTESIRKECVTVSIYICQRSHLIKLGIWKWPLR